MIKRPLLRLVFAAVLLTLSFALPARTPELKNLDEKKWHELTDNKKYQEDQKKKKAAPYINQKPVEVKEYRVERNDYFEKASKSPLLLFIIFGGALLLLLYILFRKQLFRPNSDVNAQDFDINIQDLEDNLEKVSLEDYIQTAIRGNNYKLAIRLQYLNLLKLLSQAGMIQWKKEKTNRNYLNELSSFSFFKQFNFVTIYFEKVWYGDAQTDAAVYDAFKKLHDHLVSTITATKK